MTQRKSETLDRALRSNALFVLLLVLDYYASRSYHSALIAVRVRFEFATGHANEDQDHGLRYQEMWSASRTGHRKAATQTSRSITSTSTVRRGGLSTSTLTGVDRHIPRFDAACPHRTTIATSMPDQGTDHHEWGLSPSEADQMRPRPELDHRSMRASRIVAARVDAIPFWLRSRLHADKLHGGPSLNGSGNGRRELMLITPKTLITAAPLQPMVRC